MFYRQQTSRVCGFSLIEMAIVVVVLSILVLAILSSVFMTQKAFAESEVVSRLTLRARNAMDRIVFVASQAVTTDTAFTPLNPATGTNSHGFRFRQILSFDPDTGQPVFDDLWRVFIYGPDSGSFPCDSLVILRGPDLATLLAGASGADATFGTNDDLFTAGGNTFVEMLIPGIYNPASGDMVNIDFEPAPFGRLLTITLRLNVRGADGNFLLPDDLVITERLALKQ